MAIKVQQSDTNADELEMTINNGHYGVLKEIKDYYNIRSFEDTLSFILAVGGKASRGSKDISIGSTPVAPGEYMIEE